MESRSDLLSTVDPGNHGDQASDSELSHSGNQLNIMASSLASNSPVVDDTLTIAYQDHFDVWPQAEYLFKYLTRFDLKLSRNLKLESLNEQLMKGTGHEDLHVTVKCQYVSLPVGTKTQDTPEVHRFCKGKEKLYKQEEAKGREEGTVAKENPHDHGGSDDETPTKENEEEAKDEIDIDIASEHQEAYAKDTEHLLKGDESIQVANKDANYPYLHLFLIPPSSLSDYKHEIKPRMKEFIASRMENKLNEEFLIVAFLNKSGSGSSADGSKEGTHRRKSRLGLSMLTGGKEGEDKRVVEKVRMRLFKQKLRSRLVVVTLDQIGTTDAENPGIKQIEPMITSAIKESGIDKMMRTLLNLSLNKRYLYILINLNKMFLPFLSASTAGANTHSGGKTNVPSGERSESTANKEAVAATATNTRVSGGISPLTVGNYLEFVEAVENLCNLFYKIQLTLESVVLYEFLLYNEHFGKLLSLFKAAKVDEEFYKSYKVLNSYSSAYYSTLSCNQGPSCSGVAAVEDGTAVARYCYVRYRLYILSKQLLMLNTITTSSQDVVGIDRLSIGTETTERVSRVPTSALEGVVTMPSSVNMGTNASGSFENLLLLPVLLIYNLINDVYFQVIGSRAIPNFPINGSSCPESVEDVIPKVTEFGAATSTGTVRRIKWLILTTIELIRHLENKLNSELLDDGSNDDNYLGEVVRGKKKKFRFLKSIFKTGSSKGSGHAKGSSTAGITSMNIAWVVKSYYGIKFTENLYKYVSFIYLVLYKLVLQLASATSGGSTTVTAATTVERPKYDEDALEVYIDSVYDNCIRLHYANITSDNKAEDVHSSATNPSEAGVSSAESLMRTIDQMLDQIVDYKVAIIERCSRYFILSNLQTYSNVLRSYYLKPCASAQAIDAAESTLGGEETIRTTDSDWLPKVELQKPLSTENLLNTDTTNADTSRTLTTERSTSSVSTGRLDKERGLGTSISVKKSVAPGIKTIKEMLEKEQRKTGKLVSTIRDTKDSDCEEGQQGERRVQCSLSNCNEYDHLFNKSFKRSSVKTLNMYPSCYNYVHVHLTKKSSEKLEGELYLHMSTVRNEALGAINKMEGAGRFSGGAEGSILEVDMSGMAVINLDNKVVNISLFSCQPDSSSSISNSGLGNSSGGNMGGAKLPDFTNRMIVCVPLKLCDPTGGKKEVSKTGSHFRITNSNCAGLTNSGAVKAGLTLNISLTNTSTTICGTTSGPSSKSEGATSKGSISANSTNSIGGKSYPVKVREIFDLRISETKGMKNVHLKVLYRDLVKIHQIYLNNNIIAGTTLLDHGSTYKISYHPTQSTTSTTPTNLIVNVATNNQGDGQINPDTESNNGNGNINPDQANKNQEDGNPDIENNSGDDDSSVTSGGGVQGVDLIKIYYSLYRKYRSSLQQLTHNQLYLIDPASLPTVDSENAFGPEDKDEEEEEVTEGTGESGKGTSREVGTESVAEERREGVPFEKIDNNDTIDHIVEVEAELVMKVPGYAFVSRPINMVLNLVSRENTRFSYSIESNESWFIEGLVVNNNVQLTEGKQHKLQFRLIPLVEGRLEVPSVKFTGVKVEVPKKEVTVFPANYLLL